ncbi:MAG TPA: hypothetical protein VJ464_09335 [Blastocatellia bacterium]|nr:hypothetical protein [Blastocatellia bacterium]
MSDEEFEKRMKEQFDQLTAIVMNLGERVDQLGERVDQLGERVDQIGTQVEKLTDKVDKLTDAVVGLIGIVGRHDRQIAELIERGKENEERSKATDERINALIAIVEKSFRRPDEQ